MSELLSKLLAIVEKLLPFVAGWLHAKANERARDADTLRKQRDVKPVRSYADVRDVIKWMRGKD